MGEQPIDADLSPEFAAAYADRFGHEPGRVSTTWSGEVVVCVLREVFTAAERALVAAGRLDLVRTNRRLVHDVVEACLRGVVERATGRHVLAAVSEVDADGRAVEVFLLDPATAALPSGR